MYVGCRVAYRRGWNAWYPAGVRVLEVHWNAGVAAWWCQGSALNRAGVRIPEVCWRAGVTAWWCQRSALNWAGVRVLEVRWRAGVITRLCQRSTLNRAGEGDRVLVVRYLIPLRLLRGGLFGCSGGLFPGAPGGLFPGALSLFRIPTGDGGSPPGLPGPVSHSVPDPPA